MLILLMILISFAAGVQSDCQCYESGNYTGRSAPLSNAYNPDGFSPCYLTSCTYVANSIEEDRRWTHLTFRWGTTTNSGGLIQIFDGPSDSGTPLIQIAEGEDVADGTQKSKIKSTSSAIFVKYTQTGNAANIYYGVIRAQKNQD